MRAASRTAMLQAAIPVAMLLMVVAFAGGSSSVQTVNRVGNKARWAMLVILLALAAYGCARERAWPRLPPAVVAAWLVGLALLSAAWSVDPRLTFERAASLGLLFAAALLVSTWAAATASVERLLLGLLGGAVAVALVGLALLGLDHRAAVQLGSTGVPTRFRGLGQSANTSALLFGLALPLAAWLVVRGPGSRWRVAGAAAFLLLDGSIIASGSRGALGGGFAGAVVVGLLAPRAWRPRAVCAAALVALFAASFAAGRIPKPLSYNPAPRHPAPAPIAAAPGYLNADRVFPLSDDVGRRVPGAGEQFEPRQAFGSSGRTDAWRGALHQVAQRPVAGYGFGTEPVVFVNRYHLFAGGVPENSYIGILLQLGAIGLASFLVLAAAWLVRGLRALPRAAPADRLALAAATAVVAAGLVSAVVQSYLVSVGNIAASTFWVAAFLIPVLAVRDTRRSLG